MCFGEEVGKLIGGIHFDSAHHAVLDGLMGEALADVCVTVCSARSRPLMVPEESSLVCTVITVLTLQSLH